MTTEDGQETTNSTHKVEVVEVKLLPHPQADKLSLVKVFGYQCVVRTEDWQGKTLGAYIPPDSVCPDTEQFAWLGRHKRIRVAKLRGMISEGLLVPAPDGAKLGDDVAAILGVTHYEPPVNKSRGGWGNPNANFGGDNEQVPSQICYLRKYDIDSLKRYNSVFEPNELVYITEKLHGCVPSGTLISMADGTRKKISKIVPGDEVLGVDDSGCVVTTKVLNVFNNGRTVDWLKLRGKRLGVGRGSHFFSVTCTPNHRLFNPDTNSYIEARELKKGSSVVLLRSELAITPVQRQAGTVSGCYKPALTHCVIDSIDEDFNCGMQRYDLETETHNYFAHGVLVHNCNMRAIWLDNRMYIGSRTNWKKLDGNDVWNKALVNTPQLEEFCKTHPGWLVYGEAYGQVQDLDYGCANEVRFAAFDLRKLDQEFTNAMEAREMLYEYEVPQVPLLAVVPYDFERLKQDFAEGVSLAAAANGVRQVREGCVVKPLKERYHPAIGRVILKLVGNGYYERT